MRESLPKITSKQLLIENNEEPKVLVTDCCQTEGEFVLNFKQIVHIMFRHVKAILSRCDRVGSLQDIEQWLEEATPSRQAQTITQLIELRNGLPKVQTSDRILLKEEDRLWIMQVTGHQSNSKLELAYDGQINQFGPEKLLQVANRQQLLFLFETTQGKRAAFWMAARPDIHSNHLFGSYYPDRSRKSVLLGLDSRSVHALEDEDNSVGFGHEILLAVGRVDLVISALNCSNISHFPSTYGRGVGKADDLLGREFVLRQFEAHRIS